MSIAWSAPVKPRPVVTIQPGIVLPKAFFGRSRELALRNYDITADRQVPHFDSVRYTTKDGLQRDDEELFLPLSDEGVIVNRILVYVITTMVPLREQR